MRWLLLLLPALAFAQAEGDSTESEPTEQAPSESPSDEPSESEPSQPAPRSPSPNEGDPGEASTAPEGSSPEAGDPDAQPGEPPALEGDVVPAPAPDVPDWYRRAQEEKEALERAEREEQEAERRSMEEFERRKEAFEEARADEEAELRAQRKAEAERREAELEAKESRKQAWRDKYRAHFEERLNSKRVPAYLVFSIGGGETLVVDEAFRDLYDREQLRGVRWGLDVYFHPNIALSMTGGNNGQNDSQLGLDSDLLDVNLELRMASFDAAAKGVLAPAYWPVRPFARAGGGFHHLRAEVTDREVGGNLRVRHYEGVAGYAVLGGGVEITTPRQIKDRKWPWGIGGTVEAGVHLGGGGDAVAAPSATLGDLGKLDLGPGYVRGGIVFLF